MTKPFFVRHHDDSLVDEVRIKIVPRFKQSDMSGDEWRVHAQIDLLRKGVVLAASGARDVQAAVARLPWMLMTLGEGEEEQAAISES
ncbi:MAG: hypothetical protein K2X68_04840, partial [Novosphingobium sp.]|nr:hypothetical protein [Novosphingobium sp.]